MRMGTIEMKDLERQKLKRRPLRLNSSISVALVSSAIFLQSPPVVISSALMRPPSCFLFLPSITCDRRQGWEPSMSSRSFSFPMLTTAPCRRASPRSLQTVTWMSTTRRRKNQEQPLSLCTTGRLSLPDDSHTEKDSIGKKFNQVLYQKVVRPPPASVLSSSPGLFLGCLVEYLSERFELPPRLPMVYRRVDVDVVDSGESDAASTLKGGDGCGSMNRAVVAWDSPLSPSSELTQLGVQVVGIYASDDDPVPTLALVAVVRPKSNQLGQGLESQVSHHRQEPKQQIPVLLRNLFADSEKQILASLDRGLQDFESGRLPLNSWIGQQRRGRQSFQEAQESMIDEFATVLSERERELLAESSLSLSSTQLQNKVLDAVVVRDGSRNDNGDATNRRIPMEVDVDSSRPSPDRIAEVAKSQNATVTAPLTSTKTTEATKSRSTMRAIPSSDTGVDASETTTTSGLDFAVQAARDAAKRRQQRLKQRQEPQIQREDDFAVEAARNASKTDTAKRFDSSHTSVHRSSSVESNASDGSASTTMTSSPTLNDGDSVVPPHLDLTRIRPPLLDPANSSPRAFFASISNPRDYSRKSDHETMKKDSRRISNISSTQQLPAFKGQPDDGERESKRTEVASTTRENKSKWKLDMVLKQSKGGSEDDAGPGVRLVGETGVGSDDEQLQATKEALDEIGAGDDMTADELLRSVIEFGSDQEKADGQDGSGFVSGALDMAKELLRAQKLKREHQPQLERANASLEAQVEKKQRQDLGFKEVPNPDEEIRRMFEAGERLAEGRIAVASSQDNTPQRQLNWLEADEQRVDNLLATEKSISSYARRLDDELAELEVQLNRSPDELVEATRFTKKNPLFDVFSGPEVYDRNVDPEKSVNWPGALPGTRNGVKLPKELEEAIKQAKFAASVLSNVEERQQEKLSEGESTHSVSYFVGDREVTLDQIDNLQVVVKEAVETGLIEDPFVIATERSRLQMLLDELWNQPAERVRDVSSSFKDLLLSENFIQLIRERLSNMAERDIEALRRDDDSLEEVHAREREILGTLVGYAQLLLKEARALGAELEAQHLEVIRSICKVAMDPRYTTEEETAEALTDAVRGMRPLFDDAFVAYLKYAVIEEEARLARAGVLDDPEHNQWLMVLKVVQQGVYKELERGLSRYIDHIWYVLRMETSTERRLLLQKLIDAMPTLDVRPFVQVVESIVGSLGDSASGEFDGAYVLGQMTNKLLQLRRDVRELLPPERIELVSRDADKWAARQKIRLMEQRRQTKKLMETARKTEHLDNDIEALGRRGEVERIE